MNRKCKMKKWGPVILERRSNRIKDTSAVMEEAQALKTKNNLPPI